MTKKDKGFSDWVLHSDQAFKILIVISKWSGFILCTVLFILTVLVKNIVGMAIFGFMAIITLTNLVKFYQLGGTRSMKGMNAYDLMWKKGGKSG